MDRVKEPVNWSAVAAEAFELKLGEFARLKKEKTMENVIERLRASKIQRGNTLEKEGREIGAQWAKDQAEYDELERVADADPRELFDGLDEPGNYAYSLALIIGGFNHEEASHDDIWEVWEQILEDKKDPRLNSEQFLTGFIEGAEEVFRAVAKQI
jgi:hypothetical protein